MQAHYHHILFILCPATRAHAHGALNLTCHAQAPSWPGLHSAIVLDNCVRLKPWKLLDIVEAM